MKQESRSIKKMRELEKKQIGLNQLLKPALYLILSLIFEFIGFIFLGFKHSDGSAQLLPTYIFFDIGLWLFVASLMLCSSKTWIANIIFYISTSLKILLFVLNATLHGNFGNLFSWDMISIMPEAFVSLDASFINFPLLFAASL